MGNFAALSVKTKHEPHQVAAPTPANRSPRSCWWERTPLILTAGPTFNLDDGAAVAQACANPGVVWFAAPSAVGGAHPPVRRDAAADHRHRHRARAVQGRQSGGGPDGVAADDVPARLLRAAVDQGRQDHRARGHLVALPRAAARRHRRSGPAPASSPAGRASSCRPGRRAPSSIASTRRSTRSSRRPRSARRSKASRASPWAARPEAFRDFIAAERVKWAKVIREATSSRISAHAPARRRRRVACVMRAGAICGTLTRQSCLLANQRCRGCCSGIAAFRHVAIPVAYECCETHCRSLSGLRSRPLDQNKAAHAARTRRIHVAPHSRPRLFLTLSSLCLLMSNAFADAFGGRPAGPQVPCANSPSSSCPTCTWRRPRA